MDITERTLQGFACPQLGLDEDFLRFVVTVHSREILRLFLAEYHQELEKQSEGILPLLHKWQADELSFEAFWHPAFARIYQAIQNRNNSLAAICGAELGLRLNCYGIPAQWNLNLEGSPVRLRWDPWLLPCAERITVISDGQEVSIQTYLGSTVRQVRFARSSLGWKADGCERLETFGTQHQNITLLPWKALTPQELEELLPYSPVEEIDNQVVVACQDALALITNSAGTYLRWIERVLRYIVFLNPQQEITISGSTQWSCGLIHASVCYDPILLAETLIHEASHLYFYLQNRIGPVDDGGDTNLYYSPVVKAFRPISRILMAYHAFANVLLFYRQLRATGIATERCTINEAQLATVLNELELPLRDNRTLTPLGLAIFKPLYEYTKG